MGCFISDQWKGFNDEEQDVIRRYINHDQRPVSLEQFMKDFKEVFSKTKRPFSKIMWRIRLELATYHAHKYVDENNGTIPLINPGKLRTLKTVHNKLSNGVTVE